MENFKILVTSEFLKNFPGGTIKIRESNNNSLHIHYGIEKSQVNGYLENDCGFQTIVIHLLDVPELVVVSGSRLYTKSEDHRAMGVIKAGLRCKKGSLPVLAVHLSKHFSHLRELALSLKEQDKLINPENLGV
jgi:hypothetical protein